MPSRDQRYDIQEGFRYKRKKYFLTQKPKEALFDLINQHLKVYEKKVNEFYSMPSDEDLRKEFSMLLNSLDSWHLAISRCTVSLDLEKYGIDKKSIFSKESTPFKSNIQQVQSETLSFNQALFLILGLNLEAMYNEDTDALKNNAIFDPDNGYNLLGITSIYDVVQQAEEYLWLSDMIKLTFIGTSGFIGLLLENGIVEKQGNKINTDDNQALKILYWALHDAELIFGKYENKWKWIDTGTLLVYFSDELQKAINTKKIDIGLEIESVDHVREIISHKGQRLSKTKNKAKIKDEDGKTTRLFPKNYQKIDDIFTKIL